MKQNLAYSSIPLCCVIVIQVCLLLRNVVSYSPTIDEPAHLMSGLRIWQTGHVDSYLVNPPLVRLTASLASPILGEQVRVETSKANGLDAFSAGRQFVDSGGVAAERILCLARLLCLPYCILGSIACYLWATDLYGRRAGLAASILWSSSPDMLGHGCLITPDAHAAALLAFAGFLYWKWLRVPTWPVAAAAGVALGIACLAKATLLLCFPLWVGLWVARAVVLSNHQMCRVAALQLCCLFLIAFYLIGLGYGFEETPSYASEIKFKSNPLTFVFGAGKESSHPSWYRYCVGNVPIPLPSQYLSGIDQQLCHFDLQNTPSYLRGEFRRSGWWYYYAYAICVKWPTAVLLLFAISVLCVPSKCAAVMRNAKVTAPEPADATATTLFDSFLILSCAFVFLVIVSSQVGMNKHPRYAFPAYPFIFVWISQLWSPDHYGGSAEGSNLTPCQGIRAALIRYTNTLLLASACIVSLCVSPNHLSFFNWPAGGMRAGPRHLIDSAVDWGQDLYRLRKWRSDHLDGPLYVALYCDVDPKRLGIDSLPAARPNPFKSLPSGYYAISVSILHGMPWFGSPKPDNSFDSYPVKSFEAFRTMEPVGVIGGSILVFQIDHTNQLK